MSYEPSPEVEVKVNRTWWHDVLHGIEEPEPFLELLRRHYTHEVETMRLEFVDES